MALYVALLVRGDTGRQKSLRNSEEVETRQGIDGERFEQSRESCRASRIRFEDDKSEMNNVTFVVCKNGMSKDS